MHVSLDPLVPMPALSTLCGYGLGMAVCPHLRRLLATSSTLDNMLTFFSLPEAGVLNGCTLSGGGAGRPAGAPVVVPSARALGRLTRWCTLGGASSPTHMHFKFSDGYPSGGMAFTGPATCRHLLVTDAGDWHDAVHVIDVMERARVGYVAAPGTIAGPRGIAARGALVAVSAWKSWGSGDHVVQLFEGSGVTWSPLRVLAGGFRRPGRADGQLNRPFGLRFTGDGTGVAVVDVGNDRVSLFHVADGCFERHVTAGLRGLKDILEVEDPEGGGAQPERAWLVACGPPASSTGIEIVSGAVVRAARGKHEHIVGGIAKFNIPVALAVVPGLGLAVRELRVGQGPLPRSRWPCAVFHHPRRHRGGLHVRSPRGVDGGSGTGTPGALGSGFEQRLRLVGHRHGAS